MTITYNDYVAKLDSIFESVKLELTLETLTESVDDAPADKAKRSSKIAGLAKAGWAVIKKLVRAFINLLKTFGAKLKALLAGTGKLVVSTDFNVPTDEELTKLTSIIAKFEKIGNRFVAGKSTNLSKAAASLDIALSFSFGPGKDYAKGAIVSKSVVQKWETTRVKFLNWAESIASGLEGVENDPGAIGTDAVDVCKDLLSFLNEAGTKLVKAGESITVTTTDSKPMKMKDIDKVTTESATMLRIKKVKLLIEAANELDALDFQSGEGIDIDEKPVEANEYPDDVSGGDGEEIDFEELKDIIGDDEEALAILTDDEDSKIINEAIDALFL